MTHNPSALADLELLTRQQRREILDGPERSSTDPVVPRGEGIGGKVQLESEIDLGVLKPDQTSIA
ncbi:MAG TPA: hypothetical protein RMH85_26300 [Polyangiaceae bacterium LLY-WYZ-15_(1-7)]|nr:hypothetical protein [Polyangiaceae bacterium LLY-WYZ-15_(1-7)]HJL04756.1 hypothetical protein [Polyangiaceae bacterium LLY-WYZ-15_(1-7)]HJL12015.1 hypothetical protein [Polyangiaceae bacterium LLY-WYZ-15_(1-7)]HJL26206.1 hypothetical protein [Polyangiaceae bacterium LLY-WYZ-15_(1-7)]HJL27775.1 hypothetical protein [Polyangiaceae bacterium LLY-WYZ-15_(1-7)]